MVRGFIMTAEVVNLGFFFLFYLSFECVIINDPHLYQPARKFNLLPLSVLPEYLHSPHEESRCKSPRQDPEQAQCLYLCLIWSVLHLLGHQPWCAPPLTSPPREE